MSYISENETVRRVVALRERAAELTAKKGKREAQLAEVNQELEAIRLEVESRLVPTEPRRGSVLAFTKYYHGLTPYRFAAIKSGDHWYVTGRRASNMARSTDGGHTWESLVKLIRDGEKSGAVVNVCVYTEHGKHLHVVNP